MVQHMMALTVLIHLTAILQIQSFYQTFKKALHIDGIAPAPRKTVTTKIPVPLLKGRAVASPQMAAEESLSIKSCWFEFYPTYLSSGASRASTSSINITRVF